MADEGTIVKDVMATPEQVLAAGGVSKRRRGASSSKKRSPSGQRRRAPTPEPPKDLPLDPDEEMELKSEISPTRSSTVKRISTTEKTLVTKRSHSSPGEGRQSLFSSLTPEELKQELFPKYVERTENIEQKIDLSPTKPVVTKRKSTSEKIMVTKRSQSSPGEGRQALHSSPTKEEATTPTKTRLSSDGEKDDLTPPAATVKKSPSAVMQGSRIEEAVKDQISVQGTKTVTPVETVKVKTLVAKTKVISSQDSVKASTIEEGVKARTPVEGVKSNTVENVPVKKSEESFQTIKPIGIVDAAEDVHSKIALKSEIAELPAQTAVPAEEESKKVAEEDTPAPVEETAKPVREAIWGPFFKEMLQEWRKFVAEHSEQWAKIISQRNRCVGALVVMFIYCGLGGLIFRFTEGAFEAFYKCGVKRVKRDFIDSLWMGSHHMVEDEWKSQARRKLMELETQLHAAHEAGVTSYSGLRSWSFLNAIVYCLTVVTTIVNRHTHYRDCHSHSPLVIRFIVSGRSSDFFPSSTSTDKRN
ncbi:hypothetical protein ANN_20589 [Periplaneta americana]|uniref:Uncharacterized protein n=1 Tax=Periplaneta americana TaxID=6978 RepID=A0ABQ8SD78_PERAM|nr:hypothetical protein ANN_20589 [Periplaneta americana]